MRINILKVLEHGKIPEMIYMKDNGEMSKRTIKVLSISKDSINAYCFLRGTNRTFKIKNVLAFIPVINEESMVI
ncbi:transcriptional regulator [Psychrobacillus sp. PGGUH221]|uniref:transcriptional regulator n=1 Tax=Psychrobacillus sp. PGGUH221 TaxID=3020058 RepID=UPI0035C69BEF